MKKLNISAMSVSELQQLKADIDAEIGRRSEKIAAIDQVKRLAAEKGLKIEDLIAELGGSNKTKGKRELGPAPVRYKNPANAGQTWSGRGKRPTWLADALSGGASLDSFKV